MSIRFPFEYEKAIAAMVALLDGLGGECDKAKLMKLLYLADREHFLREGFPITGDAQVAMRHGPLPSGCLDLLNGQCEEWREVLARHVHTDNYRVSRRRGAPAPVPLADSERRALADVLRSHGAKETWVLVRETHLFPEYREVYLENTSTLIPYEVILKHHGGPARFRRGRPVIARTTVEHMLSPFRGAETDL